VPKTSHHDNGPTDEGAPADELVLAAVERAVRHRARETPSVPIWAIAEHLGVPRRSARGRRLRPRLQRLTEAGLLTCARHRGVIAWALTAAGRRRLRAARLAGLELALPESPQHLAWRRAQTAAACELARFSRNLSDSLEEARRVLDAVDRAHSDVWFELGERLHRDARRLASACHCLYEWAEPVEERADVDERKEPSDERLDRAERARARARRVGRRNIHLWQEPPNASDPPRPSRHP
jgi:hypothetical protein